MSHYLTELLVIHTALMLGYWFLLRKESQYSNMRFYLLGSTLLAIIIPLLSLPKLLFNSTMPTDAVPMEILPLKAVHIAPAADVSSRNHDFIIWLYIGISVFLLFRFLSSVFALICLERRSTYERCNDLYIRRAGNIKGSFTFFNWIFLSDEIDKTGPDYELIVKHEKAHVAMGHTYDILFLELFKVCFWWLPTAWFINREIRKIHEYQADAYALKSYTIDQYSSILIRSTLQSNGLNLASSFHNGLILKRLKAMKQQAKKVSPWKLGALGSLLVILFTVFACNKELEQELKEIGSQSNMITFDQLPSTMQANLAEVKDGLLFMKVGIAEENKINDIKELKDLDPNLIHSMNVDKPNKAIYIAIKKDGSNFNYLSEKSKMQGDIFTVVEELPEFEGGMDAFYKYVMNEMKYPLQARQQGVEGRVDIQFVVEKDGSLSNVKAVNGIGAGCDNEAVRVVQNAPSFKPGMQRGKPVRVRMLMPIVFKLNEGHTNEDNSPQGIIVVEKAESKNGRFKVNASYNNGEWRGTVYDEAGEGLPGVNIVVTGTTSGTVSAVDGSFRLKAGASQDLSFSFVGYESVKVEGK